MSRQQVPELRCFDLDGCLIVSDAAIADGLTHALEHVGLPPIDAGRIRAAIGPPLRSTFTELVSDAGYDPSGPEGSRLIDDAVGAYRRRYEEVGFGLSRPVDGIPELLQRIRGEVGRTVIVTAKPAAVAEPLLEHLGLREVFDAVHGAPMDRTVEAKRVTLARALASMRISPDRSVMIGDRSHDVVAGRACGTRTIGVLWGAGDRDELEQAGADFMVERPGQLESVLLSSGSSAGR